MLGRGAQGQPWLFADVRHYLRLGELPPPLPFQAACQTILRHLADIHAFYGATAGARIARKHIGWYLQRLPDSADFRRRINQINEAAAQYEALAQYLHTQAQRHEYWFRDYG